MTTRKLLERTLVALKDLGCEGNQLFNDIEVELAKPQEPVAWLEKSKSHDAWFLAYSKNPNAETKPLYTSPQQHTAAVPDGWVVNYSQRKNSNPVVYLNSDDGAAEAIKNFSDEVYNGEPAFVIRPFCFTAPSPAIQTTAIQWDDQAAVSVLNQISDGPFGSEDIQEAIAFLKAADVVRANLIEAQATAIQEEQETNYEHFEKLIHALEIIGVCDSRDPAETAKRALVDIGYWDEKASKEPLIKIEQPVSDAVDELTDENTAALRDILATLEKHEGTIERCARHARAIRALMDRAALSAQQAVQKDLEIRNQIAEALGLEAGCIVQGKSVSYAWEYLLGLIEELNVAQPDAQPSKGDLPPLPEPKIEGTVRHPKLNICYLAPVHYTADQMHEYARASIAALSAPEQDIVSMPREEFVKYRNQAFDEGTKHGIETAQKSLSGPAQADDECRKSCDVCWDDAGRPWPCAKNRATPSVSQAFPERDVTKTAEQQGIFRKFDVHRLDRSDQPGGKHYGCRYFVLDIDHDAHAPAALRAYADACANSHPQLAADLRDEFGSQVDKSAERIFTYENQPGNVEAWRFGEACHNTSKKPGGDFIDTDEPNDREAV